jgi:hypothetical protein
MRCAWIAPTTHAITVNFQSLVSHQRKPNALVGQQRRRLKTFVKSNLHQPFRYRYLILSKK